MSRKIFKLMDLLEINDDFLNRRGITLENPETRNDPEIPTSHLTGEPDFVLIRDEDKNGVPKPVFKFEVKVTRDDSGDSVEAPNDFLMPVPFALYCVGNVKAGKTTLLDNLIEIYKPAFDSIVIISPTASLDPQMKEITEKYDIKQLFSDLSVIPKIMSEAKAVNKDKRPKDKVKTLVIFDDIINKIIKESRKEDTPLNDLILNRRHFGLSVIVLSQYWKRVNPMWRTNFSSYALFRQENTGERKKIVDDLSGFLGVKKFEKIFDEATREPFAFLSINYDAPDRLHQYTQNFNTVILKENDIKSQFDDDE